MSSRKRVIQRKVVRGTAVVLAGLVLTACGSTAPTAAPKPTLVRTELQAGATRVLEPAGIVMVYVPAGTFVIGSSDQQVERAFALCEEYYEDCERRWFDGEQPQHVVYVDGYWIGRTEVTNAQYHEFVEDDGYSNREYWTDEGWSWKESSGISQPRYWDDTEWNHPEYPVVGVNWYEAAAYAEWAGARLATEAEWEKAARGTNGRTFPWGDEWDGSRCNYCDSNCPGHLGDEAVDDGHVHTAPVGSYRSGVSPYGALDMSGNVWEWCGDWYDSDYYKWSPGSNPQGPASGDRRVVRGGSWNSAPHFVRCAYRLRNVPGACYLERFGFRVVVSAAGL